MKVENITPVSLRCGIGACPAVFRTDRGTLLVIGRILRADELTSLPGVAAGAGEAVVEIPLDLLPLTSAL